MFKPRPKQQEVLDYTGGWMGVSAVPGSGKTRTLSYLASQLIAKSPLEEGQEILVVTLVNSAVGNFGRQVGEFVQGLGLLPGYGYRVRTLHGLANDIVRERPAQAGVADNFSIVDERDAEEMLKDVVETWVRSNPQAPDAYLTDEKFDDKWTRNNKWPELVNQVAGNFIKQAKDRKLTPKQLRELLNAYSEPLPLAQMCTDIYENYERGLRYRGAVDFQDLIRLALVVLENDRDFLERLRNRWVYILEDEAQDSSKLQEEILRLLVRNKRGNWVRVGDPNQAIYETFTTANPKYLRDFLKESGVLARELPNSGRCSASIVKIANQLIDWSLNHPNENIRAKRPLDTPYIELTPPGDPQGNPEDKPDQVRFIPSDFTPEEERLAVVKSVKTWLEENPDRTAVILLPINSSGSKMVDELRKAEVDYVENLRTTTSTRAVVGSLVHILRFLESPQNPQRLATAYRVWQRDQRDDSEMQPVIEHLTKELKKVKTTEDFVSPRLNDWVMDNIDSDENPELFEHMLEFRQVLQLWQGASTLPIDQLLLTVSGDVFTTDSDIATCYSLAVYLRRFSRSHPEARLPEFIAELEAIAKNQRQFTGLADEDNSFDPDAHKGKVTVTTMHKAKGLEWDRVYLMSLSNYDFPSADEFDNFIGEKWFIRNNLNLDAEARQQLECVRSGETYQEGVGTLDARIEYASERLRLLYVGITRARQELILTWNTGRRGEQIASKPFTALRAWWQEEQKS